MPLSAASLLWVTSLTGWAQHLPTHGAASLHLSQKDRLASSGKQDSLLHGPARQHVRPLEHPLHTPQPCSPRGPLCTPPSPAPFGTLDGQSCQHTF